MMTPGAQMRDAMQAFPDLHLVDWEHVFSFHPKMTLDMINDRVTLVVDPSVAYMTILVDDQALMGINENLGIYRILEHGQPHTKATGVTAAVLEVMARLERFLVN